MSWVAPRTWVTNEVVTSSLLNTHIRDNSLAVVHPYDYSTSIVDVNTSVTETSLWSKLITGGDMGPNGVLECYLGGDFLHNNVGSDTVRLRIKFGGTTIFDDTCALGSVTGAVRQPWGLWLEVYNLGSTSSNRMFGIWAAPSADDAAPTTGRGNLDASNVRINPIASAQAALGVATASDQTLEVTVQWSASSANNSFRKELAVLRLGQN